MVVALLAACFVVFIPLAMAGWHLTRNKILFFSAILFILLAAAVHLLPFASSIFSSFHSYVLHSSTSCLHYLYNIDWSITARNSSQAPALSDDDDHRNSSVSWTWSKSSPCTFNKFTRERALGFLGRSWVVVAGDSQARFFLVSLLELLMEDSQSVKTKLFKFHSNFQHRLPEQEITTDFIWAPYTSNLTTFVEELHTNGSYPDLMIMGAGLWHMLHFNDARGYGAGLSTLGERSSSPVVVSQHLFWLNLPVLITELLNTEAKRLTMTSEVQSAYDSELARSGLCFPYGPFKLLDVRRLSFSCGADCTGDGMHYSQAVYDALVQLMLQRLVVTR